MLFNFKKKLLLFRVLPQHLAYHSAHITLVSMARRDNDVVTKPIVIINVRHTDLLSVSVLLSGNLSEGCIACFAHQVVRRLFKDRRRYMYWCMPDH